MKDVVIALFYLFILFIWGLLLIYFIINNEWVVIIKMIILFIIGYLAGIIIAKWKWRDQ